MGERFRDMEEAVGSIPTEGTGRIGLMAFRSLLRHECSGSSLGPLLLHAVPLSGLHRAIHRFDFV